MCGIAGFVKTSQTVNTKSIVDNLVNSLKHRGPDGSGVFENEYVALVHTRLSIIDLSEAGSQPLFNEDKSIALICNGEIYNYQQIRNDLINKGHIFSSSSDSEVILHLYEEMNGDLALVLNKLIGMFSFSLWDDKKKQLFIARDRIGIKPLYYSQAEGQFGFASEVAPLVKADFFQVTTDPTSIYEYFLLGSVPEPNTWYSQIKALAPGHYGMYNQGNFSLHKYWELSIQTNSRFSSSIEVSEAAEVLLKEIVTDHLIADVPVGTFLSAGIDSTLITYYSGQIQKGIHSFSAAFPGEPEDESIIAANTALEIGASHQSFNINTDFFNSFDLHFSNMDQPFGISSSLSLSRISSLAKTQVKVVLSGDGADELMGGYTRHLPFYDPPVLKGIPKKARIFLLAGLGKTLGRKSLKEASEYLKISEHELYQERYQIQAEKECLEFLLPSIRSQVDTSRYKNRVREIWNEYSGTELLNRMLYLDLKTSLVDEMLTKVDRMTMNQGLEARVPFLDHRFVEFSFSVPEKFKRDDQWGKLPLRLLVEKYFGKKLAYREKTGFNSPLRKMLIEDEATREFFLKQLDSLKEYEIVDIDHIKRKFHSEEGLDPSLAFCLVALNSFKKLH